MSEFHLFFRTGTSPRERGAWLEARDLITRAERLIDTPRPATGYPAAWHVEALNVGDVSAIGMTAVREARVASGQRGLG